MADERGEQRLIWWTRSRGPGSRVEDVPVWDCGVCDRWDEGRVGFDRKVRPIHLGPGEYTFVVAGEDVKTLNDEPIPPGS